MKKEYVVAQHIHGDNELNVFGPPMTDADADKMAVKLQEKSDGLGYKDEYFVIPILSARRQLRDLDDNS